MFNLLLLTCKCSYKALKTTCEKIEEQAAVYFKKLQVEILRKMVYVLNLTLILIITEILN